MKISSTEEWARVTCKNCLRNLPSDLETIASVLDKAFPYWSLRHSALNHWLVRDSEENIIASGDTPIEAINQAIDRKVKKIKRDVQ